MVNQLSEEHQNGLRSHVVASGFPFQMRVEEEVRAAGGQFDGRWNIVGSEFPWQDEASGRSGFADLVIYRDPLCFVVECKRRSGGNWVFLTTPRSRTRRHARFCVAGKNAIEVFDYASFDPASPEAEYCVVPGSATDNRRSLERIASELVLATESVAHLRTRLADHFGEGRIAFVPLIVCRPTPVVLEVDLINVSLEEGTVPPGAAITLAPIVRFRKAFAVDRGVVRDGAHASDIAEDRERTVFVVDASELRSFLDELWHIKRNNLFGGGS